MNYIRCDLGVCVRVPARMIFDRGIIKTGFVRGLVAASFLLRLHRNYIRVCVVRVCTMMIFDRGFPKTGFVAASSRPRRGLVPPPFT